MTHRSSSPDRITIPLPVHLGRHRRPAPDWLPDGWPPRARRHRQRPVWVQVAWPWRSPPPKPSNAAHRAPRPRFHATLLDLAILAALFTPHSPEDLAGIVRNDFGAVTDRSLRRAVSRLVRAGKVIRLGGGNRNEYVRAGTIYTRNGYEAEGGMWSLSRRRPSARSSSASCSNS